MDNSENERKKFNLGGDEISDIDLQNVINEIFTLIQSKYDGNIKIKGHDILYNEGGIQRLRISVSPEIHFDLAPEENANDFE